MSTSAALRTLLWSERSARTGTATFRQASLIQPHPHLSPGLNPTGMHSPIACRMILNLRMNGAGWVRAARLGRLGSTGARLDPHPQPPWRRFLGRPMDNGRLSPHQPRHQSGELSVILCGAEIHPYG